VKAWIDIKKERPPYGLRVWAYCPEDGPNGLTAWQGTAEALDLHERGVIWTNCALDGNVTHWQPLPPAPGAEPCCGRCKHWRQVTDDDELSSCEMIECIVPGATWHCADFEPKEKA
jgi:hypothetical protein